MPPVMRLISYNILDGGEGRADPLAEIIIAQRPDIVALIEADKPEVTARIARRLNMDYFEAVGKRHTVGLLSRWPIVESINHAQLDKELTNCFLEAVVKPPAGEQWVLGIVHLHPRAAISDDHIRATEIEKICNIFADRRAAGTPHLLAGDFNADSPIQRIDPEACKPATRKSWHENGGRIPRTAIQKLLDCGYLDSLEAVRGDEAASMASFTTNHPGQRVDHIFAFNLKDRLKLAWIEHDRLAKYASDHFPVGVEIG